MSRKSILAPSAVGLLRHWIWRFGPDGSVPGTPLAVNAGFNHVSMSYDDVDTVVHDVDFKVQSSSTWCRVSTTSRPTCVGIESLGLWDDLWQLAPRTRCREPLNRELRAIGHRNLAEQREHIPESRDVLSANGQPELIDRVDNQSRLAARHPRGVRLCVADISIRKCGSQPTIEGVKT